MNDSTNDISGAVQPAPAKERAAHRDSKDPNRLPLHVSFLLLLAALSTFAGYQLARLDFPGASKLHITPMLALVVNEPPALVPASNPHASSADMEVINHMAPQQQAEHLLELAIHVPDQSLALIDKNLDSWRGQLKDTDQLFHLVLAALDSDNPRARVAPWKIDLEPHNLRKQPQSLARLLNQIHSDSAGRYLALWRLGALGNRACH